MIKEAITEGVVGMVDNKVDELFQEAHNLFKTFGGDISLEDEVKLDNIKADLAILLEKQVTENL